jgi:hypothetical protein
LLAPALWFAVYPAAIALAGVADLACRWTGASWRGLALIGAIVLAAAIGGHQVVVPLAERCADTAPLEVGLGPERQALIETLRTHTTTEARILWEDRPGRREASRWTALLPLLTERAFIGGFGPDVCIEHAYPSLVDQKLAGRPIAGWSDQDLDDFCRRYNIGWVVCWSPAAVARFRAWNGAQQTVEVQDGQTGWLFTLRPRSFVLKGQARWLQADHRHIALADVRPEDGQIVLSLHYQAGLQASPSRVQIEPKKDEFDPIPLVRLRVPGPVARLTLTWRSP